MSKYLVKLKPIGAFFFGGERTFDFYDDKAEFKNNIIKSREFPQQTSILGMIRKEILVLNKCIKEKWDYNSQEKDKIKKLIGEKSFSIIDANKNFGIINSISPVFIIEGTQGKDKFLIKIPKDHNKSANTQKYTHFKFNDDKGDYLKVKTNLSEEVFLPVDFNAKKGLSEDFIDVKTGNIIKQNEVFIKDSAIGIKLDKKHMTQKNNLFRLERYRFNYDRNYEKRNKCFAFILDLEDKKENDTFENYKNVVSLGGEESHFLISFEKVNFDIKDKINFIDKQKNNFNIDITEIKSSSKKKLIDRRKVYKIILLSDTYIQKDIYEKNCIYSISKKINFRNLKSENYNNEENKYYYKRNEENKYYYKRFEKSKMKYSLLEKGSVLFAYEAEYEKLINSINNDKFQKIGYNIFI